MHHLDSWMKIDQLDVTCFIISLFNAQHVSNVSTSILRSLRLICWVISCVVLLWYDVCWCYIWCGNRMQVSACIRLPHHKVTPIHIVPEQYNSWNNSKNKSKFPEDGCSNIRNMLRIKHWNNKASYINLVYLYSNTSLFWIKLIPYLYKTKHNGDDSPKDHVTWIYLSA